MGVADGASVRQQTAIKPEILKNMIKMVDIHNKRRKR